MLKHYIRVFVPGLIVGEDWVLPIAERTVECAVAAIDKPAIYAFRFEDREEQDGGGETLKGAFKNVSPMHWLDAKIYDISAVASQPWCTDILLSNMRCNEWTKIVKGRLWPQPFKDGDVLVNTGRTNETR